MSFIDPLWLAALLIVPLALAAHRWAARRRRRYAIRFPAASTLALAAADVPVWRRHVPAGLALAALALLVIALAKPAHRVQLAVQQASIVLVTDHSGSMQATDVQPTRLDAAQRAADTFIDKLPSGLKVGVVAFAAGVDGVQSPDADHSKSRAVIDRQAPNGATATGDALQTALGLVRQGTSKTPAALVLLSDGATTIGRDPIDVANLAHRQQVPIYTVALGSADATVPNPDPLGAPLLASPDPETLGRIAHISGGRAFAAQDSDQLRSIYQRLGSRLGSRSETRELTSSFAVAALLALLGAGLTSVRWAGRLP